MPPFPLFVFLLNPVACTSSAHKSPNQPASSTISTIDTSSHNILPYDTCPSSPGVLTDIPLSYSGPIYTESPWTLEIFRDSDAFAAALQRTELTTEDLSITPDFSHEQVVFYTILDANCWDHHTQIGAYYLDATTLWLHLHTSTDCDGSCDTGGNPTLYVWVTPIVDVQTCIQGERCG